MYRWSPSHSLHWHERKKTPQCQILSIPAKNRCGYLALHQPPQVRRCKQLLLWSADPTLG